MDGLNVSRARIKESNTSNSSSAIKKGGGEMKERKKWIYRQEYAAIAKSIWHSNGTSRY
jgi:hypothetical protein